jgi:hypothetical protein
MIEHIYKFAFFGSLYIYVTFTVIINMRYTEYRDFLFIKNSDFILKFYFRP